MGRGHKHLPVANDRFISKQVVLNNVLMVDESPSARQRVCAMESDFRQRCGYHVGALPEKDAEFKKFFTSPYVLMIHAMKNRYTRISQIEHDILPAKLFSSMETSAGRAVEDITLPVYGWQNVRSEMHSINSALDGKLVHGDTLYAVTLKSGPRCLNDEMSENFADTILANASNWARDAGVRKVDFTYGVLYGTKKLSNKKDWHILRNLYEKLGSGCFSIDPIDKWYCKFEIDGVEVTVSIRIGSEWWEYLGGFPYTLTELGIALIRACVAPGDMDDPQYQYTIRDLGDIVSLESVPWDYNPSIIQQSQLPWLFFFMRHFYDGFFSDML